MTPEKPVYSRVVQLRLTDEQYNAMALEADEYGVRHTDVLRAAIVAYLHQHQPEMIGDQELRDALEAAGWHVEEQS